MKIHFLLTFDYEVPLGGFSSYDAGLFEPAGRLIELANDLKIPVVLFADICSVMMYQHWDPSYVQKFSAQIRYALENKHDVQLHIHPHWLTSKYSEGNYIPSMKYSLSDYRDDEQLSIENIIKRASSSLNSICQEVDPDYRCIAYRAGGYNVAPEYIRIINSLYNHGIRIDSSVIQGYYQKNTYSIVDYRNSPGDNFWRIPQDGPLTSKGNSDFFEVPISKRPMTVPFLLKRRLYKSFNKKSIRKRKYKNEGKGFKAVSGKLPWSDRIRMAWNPVVLTFDRENLVLSDLEKIVSLSINRYKGQENIVLTLISHPKSMGDYHFGIMKDFVNLMKTKYGADCSFTTYPSLHKILLDDKKN